MIGDSTSKGGRYRNVKLTGESTLEGDVDCVKLSQIGELKVKGDMRAEAMRITGECEIKGALAASKIGGRGELKVNSGLRAEKLKFTGNVDVGGNCEAGTFEVNGAFDVEGLVSAEWMDIRFFGPCRAREIGGGKLRARRSRTTKLINLIKSRGQAALAASVIEGDDVELEHTTADVVRGNRVSIGPGCRIGRVEYRDSLSAHKSAVVGEVFQQ